MKTKLFSIREQKFLIILIGILIIAVTLSVAYGNIYEVPDKLASAFNNITGRI